MSIDVNILHVNGESKFVDDFEIPSSTLYASVLTSKIAKGKIVNIDKSEAEKVNGVVKIIDASDIPGENQIGNIISDEPLFATEDVHFVGQPILIVLAESKEIASRAKNLIDIFYEKEDPILTIEDAVKNNSFILSPKTFEIGDVKNSWNECDEIISDRVISGAQEHLYLETQAAIAVLNENRNLKIYSSTQSPSLVQKTIAKVLNISMNNVEVDVLRLGGGFGGKEDQATPWAVMCALGAFLVQRPVKLVLDRNEDLNWTGKRHPYISEYKIGMKKDGKILAYEVKYYQNSGASADLSPAILERTLFHSTNSYFIPNVKATAVMCKTNLPPNTAFRGFGGPQAMFVLESALHKASGVLGISVPDIQFRNLISKEDEFPYGMRVKDNHARICWDKAINDFNYQSIKNDIEEFNNQNRFVKRGFSLMPVCFGISFTSTFLNQASALVHIYVDGSIGVSTAAVEMGQGVNEKLKNIVSRIFSIESAKIKIESTNTTRVANASPTAASSAADLNGNAVKIASEKLLERIKERAAEILHIDAIDDITIVNGVIRIQNKQTELVWNELIYNCYLNRISLSEQAFYNTPNISFDKINNKGDVFAYHVTGTAITTAEVDCLRGYYKIRDVKIVHGTGNSLNEKIDLGQIEGGLVQGIGWATMEEILYNEKGELITDSLSTYKVPDINSAPNIETVFYDNPENSAGPFNSKAVGEPPFMYGIGSYFAIINAMKSFKPKMNIEYNLPLTPEKVLLMLYKNN